MKKLLTITISILAMSLAGCNFYTDVDADWNGEEGESGSSDCDQLLVLLEAEDDQGRRADLAAEYSRCAGVDPGDDGRQPPCEDGREGEDCRDDDTGDHEHSDDGECHEGDVCDIDCQQVEVYVSGHTADEALHFCEDMGLTDATCQSIVDRCLGDAGAPGGDGDQGSNSGICDVAYDALRSAGIDPDSVTSDEAYELCIQTAMDGNTGYQLDEATCQDVASQCFADGPGDTNVDTCADLLDQASAAGADEPTTQEEANRLYEQCLQATGDEQICTELIVCYGFMP